MHIEHLPVEVKCAAEVRVTVRRFDISESESIVNSIRRLLRLLRQRESGARIHGGLSAAQYAVLSELRGGNPVSLSELAEKTMTDQSSVSLVVGRLVKAGMIYRTRSRADRRRGLVTLAEIGRERIDHAPAAPNERIVAALDSLNARDRTIFAEVFQRLLANLERPDRGE